MTTTSEKLKLTELKNILADDIHGSSEILSGLINHLLKYSNDKKYVIKIIPIIKDRLSHFEVINKFLDETKKIIYKKDQDDLKNFLSKYKNELQNLSSKIFHKYSKLLIKKKVILTISHSKTIINLLKEWVRVSSDIFVYVCESRPGMEGLITAKELTTINIKNKLITEASAGKITSSVDLIILGADKIYPDGSILNKTGSKMLSILGKYHKVPVYVIATKDKRVVSDSNKLNFDLLNFELVEQKLISRLLTD